MCSCRWQRDRRDALTWQGTERSPCRQGATRAAQGPDPGRCLAAPQVRPHVMDFADPLGGGGEDQVVLESAEGRLPVLEELRKPLAQLVVGRLVELAGVHGNGHGWCALEHAQRYRA